MNTNDKQQTDLQNLLVALNQYGEQQKALLKKTDSILATQGQLQDRIIGIEGRLTNIKVEAPSVDTRPFRAIFQEMAGAINQKLAQLPACGGRKFHIQVFPEREAGQYIRAILVRCCMWFVILVGIFYLYKWGIHWVDHRQVIQLRAIDNQAERKAWQDLYNRSDRKLRKRMDSLLITAAKYTDKDNAQGPAFKNGSPKANSINIR